ncbi:MAG: hypothetical protein HWE22_18070 [Flavobacteriales bacterium]|nr:hypothetical protein [Flavobacteriales bacterium]
MKSLITSFCLFFVSFAYPQEVPPTLSFGLDKVLFGKGVIDVDLLTDIIAEKQDELKSRIIEQHILEPVFKNTSFATRNYVFSVVRDLLHEKDKNVLKKQVMEQTVNYAVIYAISELFVSKTQADSLLLLLKLEGKYEVDLGADLTLFKTRTWQLPWINRSDISKRREKKFNLDSKYRSDSSKPESIKMKHKLDSVAFNDLLMDCVLQAIIANNKLKEKGFLNKAFYFNLEQFESMSYYHRFKNDAGSITIKLYNKVDLFVRNIADFYESFELLEKYLLDSTFGETKFNLETFKLRIRGRASELLLDLKKNETNVANELVERIKNDLSGINYLKITKRGYVKLVVEIATIYDIGTPSDYYTEPGDLKSKLLDIKNKYALDSVILKSAIQYKNVSLLSELEYQEMPFDLKDSTMNLDSKIEETKIIFEQFKQKMKALRSYIENVAAYEGLIFKDEYLASETNKHADLKERAEKALIETYQLMDINMLDLNDLLDELQAELFQVAQNAELDLTPSQDSIIANLFESFYYLKYNQPKTLNLSYISFLHNEVLPKIQMLNINAQGRLTNTALLIEQIAIYMEHRIVQSLLGKLDDKISPLSNQFKKIFDQDEGDLTLSFFLKFFEHLDRLDEIDTYYYLLEQIKVAGEQCDNRDVANAISLITQSVEKYSKFVPEEERIDFDVELIIGALYDRYGNRDKNPLNFHLTLGLNNAFALNNEALVNGDGKTIRNLGYASEKIGIRWNLWNFAMRHTYLDGEKKPRSKNKYNNDKYNYDREPLISDIHLMLYGSGFLYQLADLGTTKDIQATFVGSGLGTTFYNNLNFNVSYMLPIQYDGSTTLSNGAINVGFDIYFGEYLTALNKKRKENKKLKLEAKYAHNSEPLETREKVIVVR